MRATCTASKGSGVHSLFLVGFFCLIYVFYSSLVQDNRYAIFSQPPARSLPHELREKLSSVMLLPFLLLLCVVDASGGGKGCDDLSNNGQ